MKRMLEDLHHVLFEELNECWTAYERLHHACGKNASLEVVHDVRTSARRLRAMLGLIQSLGPGVRKDAAGLERRLKGKLIFSSALRDLQVQEKKLKGILNGTRRAAPELAQLLDALRCERKREARALRREVRGTRLKAEHRFLRHVNAFLLDGGNETWPSRAHLILELRRARHEIDRRLKRADADDPASIHKVRIAFKKYRYSREALDFLVPMSGTERNALEGFQDLLGDVQDAFVGASQVESFLREHPQCITPALEDHLAALRAARKKGSEKLLSRAASLKRSLPMPGAGSATGTSGHSAA